ncbi:ATP-binding protein [Streptomyces achromogenes]|uniref:ATP-binding protein n=1 Tax=Streptomyces achromogenes TaxID=67255 RepID=UPI000691AC96|nr:ATP-binding protein [Streptomyces achromogenes]
MTSSTPLPQVRVLPRQTNAVPDARHFVADVLKDWGLLGVLDDAATVVTELVTNAVQHTQTPTVRVIVRRMPSDAVRVIVIDKHPDLWPALQSAGPLASGGRGLALVDAVTKSWGCTRLPWEKYVWADLEVAKDA